MRYALERGAVIEGAGKVLWNVSGQCRSPLEISEYVRPAAPAKDVRKSFVKAVQAFFPGAVQVGGFDERPIWPKNIVVQGGPGGGKTPLGLRMIVPCRKCDRCLRKRARLWTLRAITEVQSAPRTWFGTLTLRPRAHQTMVARARVRIARNKSYVGEKVSKTTGECFPKFLPDDFDALSEGQQFLLRHREINVEITKYLKRIRKASETPFRYICVLEKHKTGLPHYHLLVHEMVEGSVKSDDLASKWELGIEYWRVVEEAEKKDTASYVCKYLSKANEARVRASLRYGSPPLGGLGGEGIQGAAA